MFVRFLTWWADQMLGFLPRRLRQWGIFEPNVILITPEGELDAAAPSISVAVRKGRETSNGARVALDDAGRATAAPLSNLSTRPRQCIVQLSAETAVEKLLALPLVVEHELKRVLTYEMDRETPFAVEEIYWGWQVERRDESNGRLWVRLSLVPKATVAKLLGTLAEAGFKPTALAIRQAGERWLRIPLIPLEERRWRCDNRAHYATAIGTALLLAAACAPFIRQSFALHAVDRRIEELQPQVAEAEQLRHQTTAGAAAIVAAERARYGDPLQILAALTAALPDDTSLSALTSHARKVTLTGHSASAAMLIGSLSADHTFKNPTFAAPVNRGEGSKEDQFSISVEIGSQP
jgi:general secretion pathway protein L